MPTALTRIATGMRQRLATASTAASRAAVLSAGFTASSRSSTTRSAADLARLGDRARVRGRQEQHRPHGEQVDGFVAFRFRSAHGRRIMPRNMEAREEEC